MIIEGRTFIISGGASGLGLATARYLTSHGGYVAILDLPPRDAPPSSSTPVPEGAIPLPATLSLPPTHAAYFPADTTSTASLTHALTSLATWHTHTTHAPLGGLILCAGISGVPSKIYNSRTGLPLDLLEAQRVIAVNLVGTLDLLRLTVPYLLLTPPHGPDAERGVVVLVSSSAASAGQVGQAAYAASKGGVRAMTLPLARDLAPHGIRVVAVAPSLFETGMTEGMGGKVREGLLRATEFPRRAGRPEEFAGLVGEVVRNGMLNGCTLRLDGAVRMPSRL